MNEISVTTSGPLPVPTPRRAISIRLATMADLPFLDALQKKHSKQLGYFPTKQFEGYIEMGGVLIAEGRHEGTEARRHEGGEEGAGEEVNSLAASSPCPSLRASVPSCLRASPLGYIISRDRYLKRDELGVIYQLCVAPGHQRGLIGASLVKSVFERSAYGCRLYCCWCAQDLDANYFWESLGFVPLAFRGGSTGKKRVHIFWQKRIGADDTGERATPWWFPAKTDQGAMREDRVVLPIPPGLHWRDPMPVLSPVEGPVLKSRTPDAPAPPRKRARQPEIGSIGGPQPPTPRARARFGPPGAMPMVVEQKNEQKNEQAKKPGAVKVPRVNTPRVKEKCDPKLIAAARELRDRYLERVNREPRALGGRGKYDISRTLPATPTPSSALPFDGARALPQAA